MAQRNPYWNDLQAMAARAAFRTTNTYLNFETAFDQPTYEREAVARDTINPELGFDVIAVRLEVGNAYDFRSFGNGGMELYIFDAAGFLLISFDSDDWGISTGIDTILDFLPSYTGTHYLFVESSGGNSYQVTATEDISADGRNGPPIQINPNELSFYPTPIVQSEGDSFFGWTDFHVTVQRSGDLRGDVSATWQISGRGDNPTRASDFQTTSGTVNLADGESSKVITLRVQADMGAEPDETFTVTLSNPSAGYRLGNASVLGTILDDDTNPVFVTILPLATEYVEGSDGGASTHSFIVQRSSGVGTAQAGWSMSRALGTTADADDFVGNVLPSGTVTFAAGETQKLVTLQLRGDQTPEPDEAYTLVLRDLVSLRWNTDPVTITIRDDDAPLSQLAVGATPDSVAEGTGSGVRVVNFAVTRSGDLSGTSTASWRVVTEAGGANAADFQNGVLPSGIVTFAPGEDSQIITVRVLRDSQIEANERFGVVLEAPSHRTGIAQNAPVWVTILDDDRPPPAPPPPQIISLVALEPDGVLEGTAGDTSIHRFLITRSHADLPTPTLSWAVSVSGENSVDVRDFAGGAVPQGSVTFAEGELSRIIQIEVVPDYDNEPDETFRLGFTSLPAGVVFANTSVSGTIRTDDVQPAGFSLSMDQAAGVVEGTGNGRTSLTFVIVRDRSWGTDQVTWRISTELQEAMGYANSAVADFVPGQAMSGVATFRPGDTEVAVTVSLARDAIDEQDEGFFFQLNDGQPFADGILVEYHAVILDDDVPPASLAIAAVTATRAEGTGSGVTVHDFVVTRSGNLDIAATARWSVQGTGDQPANAADFLGGVLPGGTVSFAAGQASQTIKVRTLRDATAERDEAFRVTLHDASSGVVLATDSAVVILQDDDTQRASYALTPAASSRAEGNGSGVTVHEFTVTREGDLSAAQVAWSVAGHGAAAANAADFMGGVLPAGTIGFAAGQASQLLKVRVQRDATVEANEAFAVTLRGPGGQVLATASATITNDDQPALAFTASLTAATASRAEGTGTGVSVYEYTVTRSGELSAAELTWSVAGQGAAAANAADFMGGVLPSGRLVFAAGEASQVLKVRVQRDAAVEADEGFAVTLRGPAGQVLATANGSILNDDGARTTFSVAPTSLSMAERTGTGVSVYNFTVTRQGDVSTAGEAAWSVRGFGDNPADAMDFLGGVLPSGRLVFAAGEASQVVKVRVLRDGVAEADEGFLLSLPGATAIGVILDDDTPRLAASAQGDLHLFG